MRVNYKGCTDDYEYRVAEINFDESELPLMEKMVQPLAIREWDVEIVTDGYAIVELNDRTSYKMFMGDYKEVKKAVKLWMKFGF